MSASLLKIGTRGSQLALTQTRGVQERLLALGQPSELVIIRTRGDRLSTASLVRIGGTGVFVKELENALLAGEIDLAVHSLKDLPCDLPAGLTLAAIPEREDPRDALCSRGGETLDTLPGGAKVATSSLRRRSQLLAARADLRLLEVRGNVDTRLRKLAEGQFDALVAAAAGLVRLGLQEKITQYLPFDVCLPAPGQGALAIEMKNDHSALALLRELEHPSTRAAVEAERTFLSTLGGGCLVPVGALGVVEEETLILRGLVASADGRRVLREKTCGPAADPEAVGEELAARFLALGAEEILANLKSGI